MIAEESSNSWPTNTEKYQDISDSSDVILAFINSDEEDADKRINATCHITRRSKIDFYH